MFIALPKIPASRSFGREFGDGMDIAAEREWLQATIGRALSEQQVDLLLAHLKYVLEWNQRINLTSIKDFQSGLLLHIEDSLTALDIVDAAPPGMMVDIGTGGGFPGIPLAVVTGRQTLLVDSTAKKIETLCNFIKEQQQEGLLSAKALRVEELAVLQSGGFSVVTARALSALSSVMELAAPLLVDNGLLIAFKGEPQVGELEQAKALESLLGLRIVQERQFFLSDKSTKRVLIVFEKVADATVVLPRRNGMAQKRPLK
jgi:16S rRNA (guanine527-N7)-methyltransferase